MTTRKRKRRSKGTRRRRADHALVGTTGQDLDGQLDALRAAACRAKPAFDDSSARKPDFDPAARWHHARPAYTPTLLDLLEAHGIPARREPTLDLACGPGTLTFPLAARAKGYVVGVDASRRMIDVARGRVPSRPAPTPTLVCASADELPFVDGGFGAATCGHALHWLGDPELRELWRVLRPGSPVAAVWHFPDPQSPVHRAADDVVLRRSPDARRPRYVVDDVPALRAAGFPIRKRRELWGDVRWTIDRYVAYMLSRNWTQRLAGEPSAMLSNEIEAAVTGRCGGMEFSERWCEYVFIAERAA